MEQRFLLFFSCIGVQTLPAKLAAENDLSIDSGELDETLLTWLSLYPPTVKKGNVKRSTAFISILTIFVGEDGLMDYK